MINPFTVIQLGILGYNLGKLIYHRVQEAREPYPTPEDQLQIPLAAEGTPFPILYGRCRVRAPVIVWFGNIAGQADPQRENFYFYEGDILFVLGIPFLDGATLLQGIFIGNKRIDNAGTPSNFAANLGGAMLNVAASLPSTNPEFTLLTYEFGDGVSTQSLAGSETEARMLAAGVTSTTIPSFRGYAILLARISRNTPSLPAIGFDLSSYPASGLGPAATIGNEANPVDVIYDLLTGTFGKLGIPTSRIDSASFMAAAATLYAEGNGYSRAIESSRAVADVLQEILRQIDGVFYEDPRDGLWKLKLIRADFNPATIPAIDVDNCESLTFAEAGGWTSVVNKIRVVFSDRSQDYREGSATAQNQGNAVAQSEADELVLQFPGVCTQGLANRIAARELAARSRPFLRCTARVSREFFFANPGDPIAMNWPEYNISGRVFRVAAVSMGPPDANCMVLELVEDFFYTHRWEVSDAGGLPSHPGAVAS